MAYALALYEQTLESTRAASQRAAKALVGIGHVWRLGSKAKAASSAAALIKSYAKAGGALRPMALGLLASSYGAKGNIEAGLKASHTLMQNYADTPYADDARMSQFFLHFSANDEAAVCQSFRTLARHLPDSSQQVKFARHLMKHRGYKLPEVVPNADVVGKKQVEVNEQGATPKKFALKAVYPNPINHHQATVPFTLPEDTRVTMTLYDVIGRRIATLTEKRYEAGRHRVTVNPQQFKGASGIYLIRAELQAASGRERVFNRKVTFLR